MSIDDDVAAKAKAEREAAESAARTAKLAEQKQVAEHEEWRMGAANRKHAAELAVEATQLDNLTKIQAAAADLAPDLKGLALGKTTLSSETDPAAEVLFSALLTSKALAGAASEVAKAIKSPGRGPCRIFLTSDPDLVSRDAQLRSLTSRLKTLAEFVKTFSAAGKYPDTPPEGKNGGLDAEIRNAGPTGPTLLSESAVIGAATGLATMIPGIVELLAVNRTLTTKPITVLEEQALTAVAGKLVEGADGDVLLFDDTRFLDGDTEIQLQRNALETVTTALQVQAAEGAPTGYTAWRTEALAVIKAGQDALAAVDTIPSGSRTSPLAAAMASELIRSNGTEFVLVVRPAGGSATQLVSDRPLAMKDLFHSTGTVALSYRLIRCDTSQVVSAGVIASSSELAGRIGSRITPAEEV